MPEPAAAPMRPRQHDARAEVRGARKKSSPRSSTGRRATRSTRAGSPESAPAVDGRRGRTYNAAEILEQARETITGKFQSVTFSVSEIVRELGYPDKNDRALAAVRQAVLDLVGEKVIAEAGKGRGGHPRYACVDSAPSSDGQPAELVDRIVQALEVDGGRMSRLDLKTRVGDPGFDEFSSALDLLIAEQKIARVQAGGLSGYELVGGAR